MKATTITLFVMVFSGIVFGQKTEVYFGISGRNDVATNIIELYDKGYYVSGGFENMNGFYNGWNIKTDVNLEFVYDKVYEYPLGTIAIFGSTSDSNGNIYITGFITYPDQWPFVSKIDSCGQHQWCKILNYEDEFNFGWSSDIIINHNNDIVLLSTLISNDQIDKVHLIGLNKNGDVLWKKPYASKNDYPWIDNPSGYSIKEIDNDYYISGKCYWPYPDDTSHVFLRPLFIGVDSLFEEKWILPFAPLDSVFGKAFNTMALNDSILIGIGERWIAEENKNSILMFFNDDGETLGYNQIPNDSIAPNLIANVSRDIERINDSLFITFSVWGSTPDGGICSEMVIDTSSKIYNINESTFCTGSGNLIKTYNDKYVYAVTVEEGKSDTDIYLYKIDENLNNVPFDPTPHNYDSLCPSGIQSGTTDLSDCLVWTNIGDAPSPGEYYESIKQIPIKAYPNPVTEGKITFEFENTEHHNNITLKCFDLYGKETLYKKVYRYQTEAVVDITELKQGMYVAVVYSDGWPVGECKFVVQ